MWRRRADAETRRGRPYLETITIVQGRDDETRSQVDVAQMCVCVCGREGNRHERCSSTNRGRAGSLTGCGCINQKMEKTSMMPRFLPGDWERNDLSRQHR